MNNAAMISFTDQLFALQRHYHRREWVQCDPIAFLYRYPDVRDREIAGLIASSLAYGRVRQIQKSVSTVLDRMGSSPYAFLMETRDVALKRHFGGFRHRFTSEDDLIRLLTGIRRVILEYGSLNRCFQRAVNGNHRTTHDALGLFTREIAGPDTSYNSLLPSPEKGSACKRLHLFLRWMVRHDAVDPGGWDGIDPSRLAVPLDTHLHAITRHLGVTNRRQVDIETAQEITRFFAEIDPSDPVRFDFALTRIGIFRDTIERHFPAETIAALKNERGLVS